MRGGGIVYFDGVCVLCNGWVDWLLKRDRRGALKFCALQSPYAAMALGPLAASLSTLAYQRDLGGSVTTLTRSDAILAILADLGPPWSVLSWSSVLPRSLRDLAYLALAASRARLFGVRPACRRPSPEERHRFLE